MNGLEAIELMKQGKMIKSGIWIYSMDSDGVIWLKTESHTGWVEAHTFNILANDYEEYIEPKPLTGWERVDGKGNSRMICIINKPITSQPKKKQRKSISNKRYSVSYNVLVMRMVGMRLIG